MKRFLQVLSGTRLDPPPVWLMRQAGRYLPEYRATRGEAGGFLDLCYNSEKAAEVTLQPIRRYGFDASILFADILIVPHALGQNVWFAEGEGPRLDPIQDRAGMSVLDPSGLREKASPIFETVRILRRELPKETALIGFAGAPWTVATYIIQGRGSTDFAAAKKWMFTDPDGFGKLVDLLTDATVDYLSAQIEAGAEAVQVFDTWAGALDPISRAKYVIAPLKAITTALKANHPTIPVLGFPKGIGAAYHTVAAETGVDALSLDTSIDIATVRKAVGPDLPLQGNLDPLILLSDEKSIRKSVDDVVANGQGGPHIFNLGHGITKETPPEAVTILMDQLRSHG